MLVVVILLHKINFRSLLKCDMYHMLLIYKLINRLVAEIAPVDKLNKHN